MSAPGWAEGGGIVSSAWDVRQAADSGDALATGAAGLGLALDTLDFVSDPLGEAASAGFGWLIEHVDFLREPLDALAGDPGAITAAAGGWAATARLVEVEAAALGPAPAWSGPAAERYAAAEDRLRDRLAEAAAECRALAARIVRGGVAVGTVRALVRDAIADFLAAALRWLLATLASSGLGLPALVATVVTEGVALAHTLVTHLDALLGGLGAEAGALVSGASSVRELAGVVPEGLVRDAAVEWTKQASTAP